MKPQFTGHPLLHFIDPSMISSRRVVSRGPANPRPVLRSMSPCLLRDLAHRANETLERLSGNTFFSKKEKKEQRWDGNQAKRIDRHFIETKREAYVCLPLLYASISSPYYVEMISF